MATAIFVMHCVNREGFLAQVAFSLGELAVGEHAKGNLANGCLVQGGIQVCGLRLGSNKDGLGG